MESTYDKYKCARNLAWELLIREKIIKFPVDIESIIKRNGIALFTEEVLFSAFTNADISAVSLNLNGKPVIVYRSISYYPKIRFSLAHELGHVLMQHVRPFPLMTYSDFQEESANIFASRFLMPAIVIKHEKLDSPQKISDFFGVSCEAATIRHERMKVLLSRNAFELSPLERKYYCIYKLCVKSVSK